MVTPESEYKPRPRIGVTVGDPTGIGPEVALKAACSQEILSICTPVLIGAMDYLKHCLYGDIRKRLYATSMYRCHGW